VSIENNSNNKSHTDQRPTYFIRKIFSCRLPQVQIVLDSKVLTGTTRVVTGCQKYAALRNASVFGANGCRHCRGRHDARAWNPDVFDSIPRQYTANDGNGLIVVVTAIARYNDTVSNRRRARSVRSAERPPLPPTKSRDTHTHNEQPIVHSHRNNRIFSLFSIRSFITHVSGMVPPFLAAAVSNKDWIKFST
jgi:hypothetical protein